MLIGLKECIFCGSGFKDPCMDYSYPNKGQGLMVLDHFICDNCIPKVYEILFNEWNIKGT